MEHTFSKSHAISPRMKGLLKELAPYVVVVGSVCRGKNNPKDLDLLFDFDSEHAYKRIAKMIDRYGIPFGSVCPGHWQFFEGTAIEIICIHYGKSYKACRRAGEIWTFWGVDLVVAPAEYSQSREEGKKRSATDTR